MLIGKHRRDAQASLARAGFGRQMDRLFDNFRWRSVPSELELSPEVALKILFLRTLHAFCDGNSDGRYLLLTRGEWEEVRAIREEEEKVAREGGGKWSR